ncbi:MAG TPA: TIGR01777 family oxidoreductase [Pyrinomonadaceae bacterium]
MKILVSGARGLVGEALIKALVKDGHKISSLVRRATKGESEIEWHPNDGQLDVTKLEGFDIVVHLAGESIASGRWTDEKKKKIVDSRVQGTTLLSKSLASLAQPPATFICASAIGYYGNRGDELLTEQSTRGNDFLSEVCVEWEKSTTAAEAQGIRTVHARFGIILDKDGGALKQMLTPFRMGVGGKVGDGKQWMSWIALADVISGLEYVIDKPSVKGAVNFVAPYPVTNAEFTKVLGRALSRPTFLPVPAFAARLAFGEMADELLLSSAKVQPKVLREHGFEFEFPTLQGALQTILK